MVSLMTDNPTAWGHMEEEQEEDVKVAQVEPMGEFPNTRVRFHKHRTVVRYASEKSLLSEEAPTIINDEDYEDYEDDFDGGPNQENSGDICSDEGDDGVDEEADEGEDSSEDKGSKHKKDDVVAPTTTPIENTNSSSSNGDMKKEDVSIDTNSSATPTNNSSRSWFQRAQGVPRYTPRFTPPPPQEQVDNGEDKSDQDEYEEDDEDGYDSVQEESGSEAGEDPIKKIAEESLASAKKKLQEIKKEQEKTHHGASEPQQTPFEANEREKILKEVAQLKEQLRNEVEKVEQASKAASAAAAKAEEEKISLASRVTSMRSLLAVLCGCGARIVGMLVATRLLDITAANTQPHRLSIVPPLFPALRQLLLPTFPHIAVATSVSITQAFMQYFRPSVKWWWLAGVNSAVGAFVSICAAARGGAKGEVLGYAMAAGCIVGIISSSIPKSLT